MEFLSKYYRQIATHLGGLSTSQRLALGLCVLLLMLGAGWLLQWSSRPDLVPLLDQPMKADELTAIETQLRANGRQFTTAGSQILVRADERTQLQGLVAQLGLMPADTSIGFARLIEESNMWIPREESRWQRKIALGNELSKVLSHFDSVAEARVFIDQPERRGFAAPTGVPTASVFLRTRPGSVMDKQRIAAIAALVSGAVNGLRPDAVRIVDATSGRPYRVPSEDDAAPFDLHELRRQKEDYYGRKILAQLSFIPGVLVGVNVDIDGDRRRERVEKYGPPVPSEEESISSESRSAAGAAGPGVRPNTRAAVTAGGAGDSSTSEESRTTLLGERDKVITDTDTTPGHVRAVTASVNVPRSYFMTVYGQLNDGKAPSQPELDALIESETKKIRAQVKQLIAAASDAQVDVSWFYDNVAPGAAELPGESGPTAIAGLARTWGRQVALGVLAMISLFMVVRMARRPAPWSPGSPAASGGPEAPGGRAARREGSGAWHESSGSRGLLIAPELDESTARMTEMANQIGKLVDEEPEMAAMIVERWINQSR